MIRIHVSMVLVLSMALTIATVPVAFAQGPQLQLDALERLAAQATDSTEVSLDPQMLQMAGPLMSPADAAAKQAISELKGVYVRSFEFARDGAYSDADIEPIRKQLATGNWSRVVRAQSRQDGESVEVYVWRDGDRPGGLALIAMEPREVTVVNLIGPVDLASLASLGGQFGVPSVPLAPSSPTARPAPAPSPQPAPAPKPF